MVPAAIEQPFSAPPPPPPPPPFAVAPPSPGAEIPFSPDPVPKKSKAPIIAVAIVLVAVLVAVGVYLATKSDSDDSSPAGSAFPAEVRDNFLESCAESSDGQQAYCECVLVEAEAKYTMDEFAALEERYTNGEAQAELDQLVEPCLDLIAP